MYLLVVSIEYANIQLGICNHVDYFITQAHRRIATAKYRSDDGNWNCILLGNKK